MTGGEPGGRPPDNGMRIAGNALVLLQFLLLGALALAALAAAADRGVPGAAWAVGAAGTALGLWAASRNRPGNFNIRPEPRIGGRLIVDGPYRWIRHPMYTAVIAIAAACALVVAAAWSWIGVVALVAVLVAKARIEERAMAVAHPEYEAYRARTKRFVPWLA